jgi:hypothetical protein
MRKLSDWIQKVSTRQAVMITALVFLVFTAFVLPNQSAQADAFGKGMGTVDTSFVYSVSDLFRVAEGLGEEGRAQYVRARWTFDLIWPLVYTAFLATAVSYLLDKAFSHQGDWHLLNLIPVVGMLFDYLENIAASGVMMAYPDKLTWLALLSSWFTPVKWVAIGDSFTLVAIGLIAWVINSRKMAKVVEVES